MYDKSYKAFLLGFSTLDMLFIGASEIENFASFPDLCETPEHFLWSQSEIEIPRINQTLAKFDEIGTFYFPTSQKILWLLTKLSLKNVLHLFRKLAKYPFSEI